MFKKLRFRDGSACGGRPNRKNKAAFSWRISVEVGLTVETKLRFRDGLVWTVGLTIEIKLRFRDGLVWTVGLTVEIKLAFLWRISVEVGLTVETKLRFRDGLVWTVGLTIETSNFNMKVSAGEGIKSCGIHTSLWTWESHAFVFDVQLTHKTSRYVFSLLCLYLLL